MSEALSDAMSTIREHAPSMPSAKDARDAVKSHLPSIDTSAIAEHLPNPRHGKRKMMAIIGGLAAAAAAFGIARRRRTPEPATLYTPPLPKP
ncbi:MAG TPA: hypothetical protein VHC43_05160 [Mycobacteriales bacterium]|nr:hypothetical protein [Mycobacteriales bacterium]